MKIDSRLTILFVILSFILVKPAFSDDSTTTRESLKGLNGIGVAISSDADEYLQKMGLSEADIEAEVMLKLKLAGIRILSPQEVGQTAGWPHLQVSLMTQPAGNGKGYSYAVFVELLQGVQLQHNPDVKRLLASTWSSAYPIGYIDSQSARDIRQVVANEVNNFVQAYKSVNPTGKTPL